MLQAFGEFGILLLLVLTGMEVDSPRSLLFVAS
jgi:Kef-type K+ transport system membrane component KefB